MGRNKDETRVFSVVSSEAQVEKRGIMFKCKKKLSSYKGGQTLEKVAQRL